VTTHRNRRPQLPHGWVSAQLADIVDSIDKVNPSLNPGAEFIYLDISSIDNTEHRIASPKRYLGADAPSRARQLVRAGDILFSTVRTYLENTAIVHKDYEGQVASTGFCVLRPLTPVSSRYVFYLTLSDGFVDRLTSLQRGTSYPAVRNSDVLDQLVPIAPANEQRRIVAKIEELFSQLDAGVAALQRAKAQLQRYRQAVLKAAMTGELTREWREAHTDQLEPASVLLERLVGTTTGAKRTQVKSVPLDSSKLAALPERWLWTNVGDIGHVSGGLTKNQTRTKYAESLPYLRVANVYADQLRLDDVSTIGVKQAELDRALLHKGDLLIVEGNGSLDQIGRVALWDGSIPICVHQNHIIKVRFEPVEIGEFTLHWLLSHGGREQITRVANSTSGLYTLSLSKVRALPVPLPPLAEQRQILAEVELALSHADRMEQAVKQGLARSALLRQSILNKAFEGALVPQDPTDEPAPALLERITAEKPGREADTKQTGKQHKKKEPDQPSPFS